MSLLVLVFVGAAAFVWLNTQNNNIQPIACTMETKLCPDGTAVGRTGPNCEFSLCPDAVPTPVSVVTAGDIILGVGQKGKVGDLNITVNSFVSDSRCPIGVQCIWAGEFKVNATLLGATKIENRVMSSIDAPYSFDGHIISISSVTPAPKSTTKITANEYHITFHVAVDTKKVLGSTGIISGRVTLSPTCPVERIPPDPQCAPKGYQTIVKVFSVGGSYLIKSVQTGVDGSYTIALPFGDYTIGAVGGKILPQCSSVPVSLKATLATVDISCDTGIR